MEDIFPEPVRRLPEADIPLDGLRAYLSQADDHQILFMEFEEDAELPEHSHEGQFAIVLEGRLDLTIDGVEHTFGKGDRYYIPAGVPHAARVHAGYADVTFFDQKDRYSARGTHRDGRTSE
jgi:quercetin dioxygenase-like cupin family protein